MAAEKQWSDRNIQNNKPEQQDIDQVRPHENFAKKLVKLDKHTKNALVRMDFLGTVRDMWLAFEIDVICYFEKVQDEEIKRFLPQKARSVEEAISDFEKTLLPDATSFGSTIYVNANDVGDVWAYCIGGDEPNAMLSFCVFEKSLWGKGIASEAVRIFLDEMKEKYSLRSMGALPFQTTKRQSMCL